MLTERRGGDRLERLTDRRRIAIVQLRGVIGGAARTDDLLRTLGTVRRTARIRGLLLEIDSPGGGATASEAIHVAVKRVASMKPVVAWIRGTGASGAYFAACGATRIVTFPSAIVGSIGVISIRPIAVDALRRLGARVNVTKTGPFKDLGAPWREPTPEDEAKERELVDAVFRRFTAAVRSARRLDGDAAQRVTTGEVWLGSHAVDLGLADGVCEHEEAALEVVQDLAGLPHHHAMRIGPRRTVLQRLGFPGAGLGPPGERWVAELEGWLRAPRIRT